MGVEERGDTHDNHAHVQETAAWERALYAFLAEKERRSGSRRTVEGYSRMLQHFRLGVREGDFR